MWEGEEKLMTEDEMVGWHHRLDGHEFKQVLGTGNGLGSLACRSPQSHKESGLTERLNCTDVKSIANISLNGAKLKAFPLKSTTR